jgi:hypothetical protein
MRETEHRAWEEISKSRQGNLLCEQSNHNIILNMKRIAEATSAKLIGAFSIDAEAISVARDLHMSFWNQNDEHRYIPERGRKICASCGGIHLALWAAYLALFRQIHCH